MSEGPHRGLMLGQLPQIPAAQNRTLMLVREGPLPPGAHRQGLRQDESAASQDSGPCWTWWAGGTRDFILTPLGPGPGSRTPLAGGPLTGIRALRCSLVRLHTLQTCRLSACVLTELHVQVCGAGGQGSCFCSVRRTSFKPLLLIKGSSSFLDSKRKAESTAEFRLHLTKTPYEEFLFYLAFIGIRVELTIITLFPLSCELKVYLLASP